VGRRRQVYALGNKGGRDVRIATMIISLILMLVVGGPVVLIGGAFALAFPFVSVLAFFFAGIIGLAGGASTSFGDLTIWGVVSLVLTVLSYFGWREKRKRRREVATRVVCQPIHLSAWNGHSRKFAFKEFCELRRHGVLGSCTSRCIAVILSPLHNGAGVLTFLLHPVHKRGWRG
jgi:uncharacterized membrane protein